MDGNFVLGGRERCFRRTGDLSRITKSSMFSDGGSLAGATLQGQSTFLRSSIKFTCGCWWTCAPHPYLTESVCQVVLQKSSPAQICQLILDIVIIKDKLTDLWEN